MSFTYCSARLPSNAGGGPTSGGRGSVGSVESEATLAGGFCPLAWAAWLSRSQASSIHASAQGRSSIEDLFLNSEPFFPYTLRPSSLLRLLFLPRLTPFGMHQPGHTNAERVQSDHRRRKDAHIKDVGSRRDDGRDNKNDQDGITEILQHETGADDTHERQKENQDRHFENQAHAQDDAEEELRVLPDGDHWLELLAELDQESQRLRVNDLVSEVATRTEQRDGRSHERNYIALFIAIEAWRDEHPNLVEDERRSQEQASKGGNLQVEIERFGGIQIDQFVGQSIGFKRVHDWLLHDRVDLFAITPAGKEADQHGDDAVNEAFAQFLEVIE